MGRPLDEDDVMAAIDKRISVLQKHPEFRRKHADIDLYGIKQMIAELPSAQPEITHCAECIHWKHSAARKSYCEVFDWMSKAEDFCSFAERRDDE